MKILKNVLLIICVLFFAISCQEAQTKNNKPNVKKAPIAQNKKANKKNKEVNTKNLYHIKLQKAIGLNNAQTKGIQKIRAEYLRAKKSTSSKDKAKMKALNLKKQNKFKALLGTKLYNEKVAYDKKQKLKAAATKKK